MDDSNKVKKESLSSPQMLILTFITLALAGLLGYFIYDGTTLIGNCKNNVPVENCNKPAGDFAVEPNTTSTSVLDGCLTGKGTGKCVFDAETLNDAIKICNSLENKCNRFIYNRKVMSVVSTTGPTGPSNGTNMFVRQNGITFQSQGEVPNSYKTSNVTGENTNVATVPGTQVSPTQNVVSTSYSSGGGGGSGY